MTPSADKQSAALLVDRLLGIVADGRVNRDGTVTLAPECLGIVAALTSAIGSGALVELVYEERSWISTGQAAARTGLTDRWLRDLARRNVIGSRRIGARWLLLAADVDRHAATARTTPPARASDDPNGEPMAAKKPTRVAKPSPKLGGGQPASGKHVPSRAASSGSGPQDASAAVNAHVHGLGTGSNVTPAKGSSRRSDETLEAPPWQAMNPNAAQWMPPLN